MVRLKLKDSAPTGLISHVTSLTIGHRVTEWALHPVPVQFEGVCIPGVEAKWSKGAQGFVTETGPHHKGVKEDDLKAQ